MISDLAMGYLVAVGLFWAALGVAYYRNPDGRVGRALKAFASKPSFEAYSQVHDEVLDRLPLVAGLVTIVLMQAVIANETLPEDAAQKMAAVISFGGVEISAQTLAIFFISWWLVWPKVRYLLARAGEVLGVYEPSWAEENTEVSD